MQSSPKYRRVLLKLTGELFGKDDGTGICYEAYEKIAKQIKKIKEESNIELLIVVGSGNIFRGREFSGKNADRVVADHMGMLATIINALGLQDALEKLGAPTRMMTAFSIPSVAEPFIRRRALRHLEKGRIVIFGGGIGNPFFTTDSAAALRASELDADVILKASNVDGIYDKDPKKYPEAKLYKELTYQEVLQKKLNVMDSTAFALAQQKNIPIIVFNIENPKAIEGIIHGKEIGTLVKA